LQVAVEDEWPGIDSKFRLIVVAALRSKQLLSGSAPRIDADPLRRRNTSIALEEVKQGLVSFTNGNEPQPHGGQSSGPDGSA
jgi:DNA-directed RNA polymerase omega subunit